MGPIDGTIVPAAPGGSIPFLPDATMRVLRTIHDHYPNAWSRYGFVDAFNPLTEWYDTDVDRYRYRNYYADGRECAFGICMGYFYEEP